MILGRSSSISLVLSWNLLVGFYSTSTGRIGFFLRVKKIHRRYSPGRGYASEDSCGYGRPYCEARSLSDFVGTIAGVQAERKDTEWGRAWITRAVGVTITSNVSSAICANFLPRFKGAVDAGVRIACRNAWKWLRSLSWCATSVAVPSTVVTQWMVDVTYGLRTLTLQASGSSRFKLAAGVGGWTRISAGRSSECGTRRRASIFVQRPAGRKTCMSITWRTVLCRCAGPNRDLHMLAKYAKILIGTL